MVNLEKYFMHIPNMTKYTWRCIKRLSYSEHLKIQLEFLKMHTKYKVLILQMDI